MPLGVVGLLPLDYVPEVLQKVHVGGKARLDDDPCVLIHVVHVQELCQNPGYCVGLIGRIQVDEVCVLFVDLVQGRRGVHAKERPLLLKVRFVEVFLDAGSRLPPVLRKVGVLCPAGERLNADRTGPCAQVQKDTARDLELDDVE